MPLEGTASTTRFERCKAVSSTVSPDTVGGKLLPESSIPLLNAVPREAGPTSGRTSGMNGLAQLQDGRIDGEGSDRAAFAVVAQVQGDTLALELSLARHVGAVSLSVYWHGTCLA